MSRMIQVVFRSPEATVDVDYTRMSALVLSIRCRLAQIQELVRIRTVGEPGVGGWWRGTENVIGHAAPILPGMTYS